MDTRPLSRDAYRDASEYVNYSSLKDFSACPRLYYEKYVERSLVDIRHDYFTYGSLVDCLVTTPGELEERFIQVDRRMEAAKTLDIEMRLKELPLEIEALKAELAVNPKKTVQTKLKKAEAEIQALNDKLNVCRNAISREQVTAAMWEDAHDTAQVIKQNVRYQHLIVDQFPLAMPQVVLCTHTEGKPHRKGQLDFLVCPSQEAQALIQMWQGGMIFEADLPARFAELGDSSSVFHIIDIKTTARLSDFDPKTYAGQLAFYQAMLASLTGLAKEHILCSIIAGDKRDDRKMAQDYLFTQDTLDFAYGQVLVVEEALRECQRTNVWPSAKSLRGQEQTCFRCRECSSRPFSVDNTIHSSILV